MKRFAVLFATAVLILASLACGTSEKTATFSTAINREEITTEQPTQVAPTKAQETKLPTATPGPTNTPVPTNTTAPTNTSLPTITPTPIPEPLKFEGTNKKVLDLKEWGDEVGVVEFTYPGSGNFAIWAYDENGEKDDLVVNEIGPYYGWHVINIPGSGYTSRYEVTATGKWTITINPLLPTTYDHLVTVPGTYEGTGDDIVMVKGKPDLITFDCTGKVNCAIWSYSLSEGADLTFNEIGPYNGQAVLASDTILLDVTANSKWSVEITAK